MIIRDEKPGDVSAIREVIAEAFKPVPYSRQTEVAIYDGLRTAGAMTVAPTDALPGGGEGDSRRSSPLPSGGGRRVAPGEGPPLAGSALTFAHP
jgi:hypothetical protein